MDFLTIPSLAPTSQLEELVRKYIELESKPIRDLEKVKQDLEVRQGMMRDLNSTILALRDNCDSLIGEKATSLLSTKTVTSSKASVVTATAGSTALNGVHNVFVERLASADVVVSNQFDSTGTTLKTKLSPGNWVFSITVEGVTTNITVTIIGDEDDGTILSKMAQAINASAAAVSASVVSEAPGKARLVLTSDKTGSAAAINLSETGTGLLAATGTSSQVQSSGTSGGYLLQRNLLDAKLTIDGLSFTRGSNTVSDAIPGVTLNLHAAQTPGESPVSLEVKQDTGTIISNIQKWVDSYNKTLKYIQDKTFVDSDLGTRGPLAGEYVYVSLKAKMRTAIQAPVDGLDPATGPVSLAGLGITAGDNGSLAITDRAKLEDAIVRDPDRVATILGSKSGAVTRLRGIVAPFVESLTGIIPRQQQSITDQMSRIGDRIKALEERMALREKALRREFSSILQAMTMLNAQRSTLNSIWGNAFASYS